MRCCSREEGHSSEDSDEDDEPFLVSAEKEQALKAAKQDVADLTEKLDTHNTFVENRLNELEAEVEQKKLRRKALEEQIKQKKAAEHGPDVNPAPGPHCLSWVDGDIFKFSAILVIIVNVWIMILEYLDDEGEQSCIASRYWVLGQVFLLFYIVELALHVIYWRCLFFWNPLHFVWGNWLDVTIVATGILSAWIMPLAYGSCHTGSGMLVWMRVLRLVRLARAWKIINLWLSSDFKWVEGNRFQGVIMFSIAFNAVLLGLEEMMPQENLEPLWYWCNEVLQVIFTFELLARMKLSGLKQFFCAGERTELVWNWLDTVIVVAGIIDMWIVDAMIVPIEHYFGLDMNNYTLSTVVMLLRLLRLLRIARVIRLIRNIPPLFKLVSGIARSMAGMGWVLLLSMVVLYVCALLFRRLSMVMLEPEAAASAFPDLLTSVFNLFMVMNADVGSMEMVLSESWIMRWMIFSFIITTNWATLSILTAVVSDYMAQVTESYDSDEKDSDKGKKVQRLAQRMDDLFDDKDYKENGRISKKQFDSKFDNEILKEEVEFTSERSWDEIEAIFALLARNDKEADPSTASISKNEFVDYVTNDLSLMRITSLIMDMETTISKKLDSLQATLPPSAPRFVSTPTRIPA